MLRANYNPGAGTSRGVEYVMTIGVDPAARKNADEFKSIAIDAHRQASSAAVKEGKAREDAAAKAMRAEQDSFSRSNAARASAIEHTKAMISGLQDGARAAALWGVATEDNTNKAIRSLATVEAKIRGFNSLWSIIDNGAKAWQNYRKAQDEAAKGGAGKKWYQFDGQGMGKLGTAGSIIGTAIGGYEAGVQLRGTDSGEWLRSKLGLEETEQSAQRKAEEALARAEAMEKKTQDERQLQQRRQAEEQGRRSGDIDDLFNRSDLYGRRDAAMAGYGKSGDARNLAENDVRLAALQKQFSIRNVGGSYIGSDSLDSLRAGDRNDPRVIQQYIQAELQAVKQMNDLEKDTARIKLDAASRTLELAKENMRVMQAAAQELGQQVRGSEIRAGSMNQIDLKNLEDSYRKFKDGGLDALSDSEASQLEQFNPHIAQQIMQQRHARGMKDLAAYAPTIAGELGKQFEQAEALNEGANESGVVRAQGNVADAERQIDRVGKAFDDFTARLIERLVTIIEQKAAQAGRFAIDTAPNINGIIGH